MKPTEQQLNDLFAAARSEEPVISQDDVRSLLKDHSTVQQSGNSFSRSLFTKKGITMTSIFGAGIAAVVAFNVLVPSTNVPVTPTLSTKPQTASIIQKPAVKVEVPKKSEVKPSQPILVIENEDNINEIDELADVPGAPDELAQLDEPVQPSAPLSQTNPLAPMKVNGETILKANTTMLPKLGVEKENNGGIAFYAESDSGKYIRYVLPSDTWGLMTGADPVAKEKLAVNVFMTPTIITDARGNRRMIIYNSDNRSVSMSHMHKVNGDSSVEDHISMAVKDQSNQKNKQMKIVGIRKIQERVNNVNSKTVDKNINNGGIKINIDDENSAQISVGDNDVNPTIAREIYMLHGKNKKDSVDFGEVERIMKQYVPTADLENTMKQLKDLQTNLRQKMSIDMGDDSTAITILGDNSKTLQGKIKMLVKQKRINADDIIGDIAPNYPPMITTNMFAIGDIDNLIPVLVREATTTQNNKDENRDYDNGVIMWYQKTPELEKALQNSAVPGNSSVATPNTIANNGMITNATIFPNPAKNETHFRYSLGEARSVSFTIHNILGARIADLGEAVNQSAGLHEQNISVGNIPSGIYLLVITTDKGEQSMQRIVIEH